MRGYLWGSITRQSPCKRGPVSAGPLKGGNMKKAMAILAWIIGICLAGSEGAIYINFIGLAVFCFGSRMIVKEVQHDG